MARILPDQRNGLPGGWELLDMNGYSFFACKLRFAEDGYSVAPFRGCFLLKYHATFRTSTGLIREW